MMLLMYLLLLISSLEAAPPREEDDLTYNNNDPDYVIETGHISLNDSEFIILINSTYEIIEDFETNSTDDARRLSVVAPPPPSSPPSSLPPLSTSATPVPSVSPTSSDPSSSTTRPLPFRKLRPRKEQGISCRQYSQREKYSLLEAVGGRNQLYMADTTQEASIQFAALLPEEQQPVKIMIDDNIESSKHTDDCDARCTLIRKSLDDALSKKSRKAARAFNDAGQTQVDEGIAAGRSGCYFEQFVPVGNCTVPGEEDTWDHEQLCSVCRGIYMMSEDCFPSFFNTVKCNNKEMGCIFDSFSDKAHGKCHSETLSFKVLKNMGSSECEDWRIQHIEVPIACQCMLSKSSRLRSQPPREL